MRNTTPIPRILAAALLCVATTARLKAQDDTAAALDKMLARLPVNTATEKQAITGDLAELGAAGVREMCARFKDEPLDGKVCSALHGLVHAAGKTGNEELRKTVTGVFCEVLQSKATIAAKSHVLMELRTLARAESVGAVAALLPVTELCEPAAQTLVSIGTEEAATALRAALPAQKGAGRVTVICALGRLRDSKAVPLLLKEIASDDPATRHGAVFALSEAGDPAAIPALRKAATTDGERERRHTVHCLLQYAGRLAERGHASEAVDVSRWLVQENPDAAHIRCAGLALLARLGGSRAFPEIIDAMASENARVRATARGLVESIPRGDIDMTEESIAAMLKDASAVKHAEILKLLGQFADKVGLPAVRQGLGSDRKTVRLAAITALGRMGGKADVPVLTGMLAKHERGSEEYGLAESALCGLPGDEATSAIAETMKTAESGMGVVLLQVLARRDVSAHVDTLMSVAGKHKDEAVRVAAIEALKSSVNENDLPAFVDLLCRAKTEGEQRAAEKVLVASMRRIDEASAYVEPIKTKLAGASPDARLTLLRVLGVVGNEAALAVMADATEDADAAVRETALRALSKWRGTAAMKPLWEAVRSSRNEKEVILALRGYIELAGSLEPAAKAVEALADAMKHAKRPEEQRMVLGELSSFGSGTALDIAAGYLEKKGMKQEAAQACRRIVLALDESAIKERKELLKKLSADADPELAGAAGGKLVCLESDAFARINFQPGGCAVPAGCLADTGEVFDDRGNGHSYGWDKPNGETRERKSHEDPRYKTLNHLEKKGDRRWEIAAPNGVYWLHIVCGDADHDDQVNNLNVEGHIQKDPDGGDLFDEYELRVKVDDGRLTIAPAPGSDNAKICFVELRSLSE